MDFRRLGPVLRDWRLVINLGAAVIAIAVMPHLSPTGAVIDLSVFTLATVVFNAAL